jgi:two-component system LytT family sensor kinase
MKNLNYKRLFLHAAFWISFILLFLLIYGPVFDNFPWLFLSSMVMLPFTMLVVYSINYLILPPLLTQKKYLLLGVIILLILALEPPLPRILVMKLSGEDITFKNFLDYNLLPFYFETGLIVFIALSIKLFKERDREQKQKNLLEKQKLESELNALKSQLNAHFLFNTLNNLYGLAKKRSDHTAAGILKLSEMLHFVLYECSIDKYPILKELGFIKNYIELEKLRYGKRLRIEMIEDLDHIDFEIAPLLLFPFIENSFKHGASKKANDVWIKIHIATKPQSLVFAVENNKKADQGVNPQISGGIGLDNVQKRLDIQYPKQHTLSIRSDDSKFSIHLTINQDSEL